MEIKRNGEIVKFLRESKKITQEELALEICSVKQLQRIEKKISNPTMHTYEQLLIKLGEDTKYYSYTFENISEEKAHHLSLKIIDLLYESEFNEAKKEFEEFMKMKLFNSHNKHFMQFALLCKTIFLAYIDKDMKKALEMAYKAISITRKNFNLDSIGNLIFTKYEYDILNDIALIYLNTGKTEIGINTLTQLRISLHKEYISDTMKSLMLPMICYNLSKYLGLQARYEEALIICDDGISTCREFQKTRYLGQLLYNKAYNFYFLKDLDKATENFHLSQNTFLIMGNNEMAKTVKENATSKYGIFF